MMLHKKVYPFPLSWWEKPIAKWFFTLGFIASDFCTRYVAMAPAFGDSDIIAQIKLVVITAVIVVLINVLPAMAGSMLGSAVNCSKRIRTVVFACAAGTVMALYIVTIALSFNSGNVQAIKETSKAQQQTSDAMVSQQTDNLTQDTTELSEAEHNMENMKSLLTAVLPIATSLFLAVLSFATADSQKKIQMYNQLVQRQNQLQACRAKRIELEHRAPVFEQLKADEAARDAMLSEIQTYLIDWKNVIQLPLVKQLADPRMTTRMLADQEINQYDFPRNNEEDVCI